MMLKLLIKIKNILSDQKSFWQLILVSFFFAFILTLALSLWWMVGLEQEIESPPPVLMASSTTQKSKALDLQKLNRVLEQIQVRSRDSAGFSTSTLLSDFDPNH